MDPNNEFAPIALDADELYQIWVARDRRYDGRVFAGVRTTKIYCRPVCPAKTALKKNMAFYPSAAAAEQAGFRPCLRCRPETSPGTPAWQGTSSTVSRALRLISNGWVSENGLDALASRLGLGERQIRRLFEKHLGAPPLAILRTHQLDLARKLLDDTNLPIAQIAFASGFSSLRRFNHAFKARFRCVPSSTRLKLRKKNLDQKVRGHLTLRLSYRPPLDWTSLIEFFSTRALPGVEKCDQEVYSRTFELDAGPAWFSVSLSDSLGCLDLKVPNLSAPDLIRVVSQVREMFDLDADPRTICETLSLDPRLKKVLSLHPGLHIPGAWDGFEIGVRAILGQQVSVAAARTLAARVVRAYGKTTSLSDQHELTHLFPKAQILREADLESCGIVRARAQAIRLFADQVAQKKIRFEPVIDLTHFIKTLTEIPGIGEWTAGYIAIRALREPNILLRDDLIIQREINSMEKSRTRQPVKRWDPWCTYATLYLWKRAEIEK